MLIEPEVIRMLLFGLALVLMMLFRPAGILPSALRKTRARGQVSAAGPPQGARPFLRGGGARRRAATSLGEVRQ